MGWNMVGILLVNLETFVQADEKGLSDLYEISWHQCFLMEQNGTTMGDINKKSTPAFEMN